MRIGGMVLIVGAMLTGLSAIAVLKGQENKELSNKLSVDLGGGVKMDFVLIKAGSFMMGSEKDDETEKPLHEVTISKPFYMGVYEVTQAQWKAVMGNNPSHFKGDDLPVESVSWYDCQKFMAKLWEVSGKRHICRLPTEAQWEHACRAGSQTAYCFGDDEGKLGQYAWYSGNSDSKTHPVGQKNPNAWGLYDMHGNVWEWCADWYDENYYANSPAENPKGPATGVYRVLRGGSCFFDPDYERSASRPGTRPSAIGSRDGGFRVVISAQE